MEEEGEESVCGWGEVATARESLQAREVAERPESREESDVSGGRLGRCGDGIERV